jgi:hypothetical protein
MRGTAVGTAVVSITNNNKRNQNLHHHYNNHFHVLASENAISLNKILNPYAQCPFGPLTVYNSQELYNADEEVDLSRLSSIVSNSNSNWSLKSDRPHKFGFIIEKSSRFIMENDARTTTTNVTNVTNVINDDDGESIYFDVKLSHIPQITIEYMHSYENAGRVVISLEQISTTNAPTTQQERISPESTTTLSNSSKLLGKQVVETLNADENAGKKEVAQLKPHTYLLLDSYRPEVKYALYDEFVFRPVGFEEGDAVLGIRRYSESLTDEEFLKRGGDRFKLVGVSSC